MIETITSNGEFEQKPHREIEAKYLPLFPERLEQFRTIAVPIEQVYLSNPAEPFSLRLRETLHEGELVYTAALKDHGTLTADGLSRLEVETPIDAATYAYYKSAETPVIRKLRAKPYNNIVIDWFEDGHVHAESEHPISWRAFHEQHDLYRSFVDVTGDRIVDNEWRAHLEYRRNNSGQEALAVSPELATDAIAERIWKHQLQHNRTIVSVAGRSGSGKSTAIRDVQSHLLHNGVQSIVLSTDNYHRGKSWLEQYKGDAWTEWDAPIVYDLEAMQQDMRALLDGKPVVNQYFDFETEEPTFDGMVEPAPVILIEGIYARDASFGALTDYRYELPTPLATCIGRRLLRDLKERPQFADQEKSLRYMLEQAEPAYRRQLT